MRRRDNDALILPVTLALALLSMPFGMALRLLIPQTGSDAMHYALAVLVEEGILWGIPALLLMRSGERKRHDGHGLPMASAALALGVCTQAATASLTTLPGLSGTGSVLMPGTPAEAAVSLLALAIAPALCEEAFFRGVLLRGLCRKTSLPAACCLSVLIFALMHGSVTGLPGHLAVSVLACLLTLSTGRLMPAICFHLGYNAAAIALANCPQMDVLLLCWLPVIAAFAVLAQRLPRNKGTQTRLLSAERWMIAAILTVQVIRYFV